MPFSPVGPNRKSQLLSCTQSFRHPWMPSLLRPIEFKIRPFVGPAHCKVQSPPKKRTGGSPHPHPPYNYHFRYSKIVKAQVVSMSHHYDRPRAAAATAGAVGGKTARACDNCIRCRARWYCAADDAFLCEPCDSTVHSANPLARRHERLRLKTSSSDSGGGNSLAAPAWHHGFKRKARTPRPHQHASKPVVPELETSAEDDAGEEVEDEEQLLYRVPVFDPALAFCSPPAARELKAAPQHTEAGAADCNDGIGIEFSPSEVEMAEFSADMESLLGRGLDGGDAFCMEELGLVIDAREGGLGAAEVKAEMEEEGRSGGELNFEMEVDLSRETLDLDFDCGSPEAAEEMEADEEEKTSGVVEGKERDVMRGVGLRLDYEAVMEAWSLRGGSPWTSGERPRLGPDEYWMQCMGMWGGVGGEVVGGGIQVMNVGREARVTRYREKRRTRLFSKKIRYEVRKLNAEKRPRMKGRFVKRASLAAAAGGGGSGGGATFAY